MPVRRVSNWGGNIIGSFPSLKNAQSVKYESTIERDFLFFLEFDQLVQSYEMQPLVITSTDARGKLITYTPDVLVQAKDGRTLVECKPAALLGEDHTKRQIALGQEWSDHNNCDFIVITDADLRYGSQLANLKLLWRYARIAVPYAVIARSKTVLSNNIKGMELATLLEQLSGCASTSILPGLLYSLLFRQVVVTDLLQPISSKSLIRLPQQRKAEL